MKANTRGRMSCDNNSLISRQFNITTTEKPTACQQQLLQEAKRIFLATKLIKTLAQCTNLVQMFCKPDS